MEAGVVLATIDFHGHGYSEGMKAYVHDPLHLVDDAACFMRLLYDPERTDLFNFHYNAHVRDFIRVLYNFYLIENSCLM